MGELTEEDKEIQDLIKLFRWNNTFETLWTREERYLMNVYRHKHLMYLKDPNDKNIDLPETPKDE